MIHGWIARSLAVASFVLAASPEVLAAGDFRIHFHETRYFTGKKLTRLERVADLAERVVNSPEFRTKVLNFRTRKTVNGKVTYTTSFVQNLGLTNKGILSRVDAGSESFYNETRYNPPRGNGVADLYVSLYSGGSGVVGYTNAGRRRIYLNDYYFSRYSDAYLAGNLIHEWLHKLGFSHDSKPTTRRPYSVPYGIGGIVRDLATKMSGEQLTDADVLALSSSGVAEPILRCGRH